VGEKSVENVGWYRLFRFRLLVEIFPIPGLQRTRVVLGRIVAESSIRPE
jgi:hypothetical protein